MNCSVRPWLPELDQHAALTADFSVKMPAQRERAARTQLLRPLFHDTAVELRHARRRRARPRRKRKDVQTRQPAVIDQFERVFEHGLGLGRKADDDVSTEDHVRPQPAQSFAECDCVRPRMPALHALEDEVIACLQRQMQMRHQPRVLSESIDERAVGLDRIDRRQAEPVEFGHVLEDLPH